MYLWVFAHRLWANKLVHLSELCDPKHHGPPNMNRPVELSFQQPFDFVTWVSLICKNLRKHSSSDTFRFIKHVSTGSSVIFSYTRLVQNGGS